MKRIFTAIDIPDELRHSISEYIDELKLPFSDVRVLWEKKEKIHLTLNFLGEVDPEKLSEIVDIVQNAAKETNSFDLTVLDAGVFPNLRRPRILWIGVRDKAGALESLKSRLDDSFQEFGFAAKKGRFVPHLTIGRLRQPGKSRELASIHKQNRFGPYEFTVSELKVYESTLGLNGSTYSLVERSLLIED